MTMSPDEFADYIEKLEHTTPLAKDGFSMEAFHHTCGTPSCIAGHDHSILGWEQSFDRLEEESLSELIGCGRDVAEALAFPFGIGGPFGDITPSQAATAIRKAIAGAPVDELWSHLS